MVLDKNLKNILKIKLFNHLSIKYFKVEKKQENCFAIELAILVA